MAIPIGLAQSWALRGVLDRAAWWLPATVGGALLGTLAAEFAYQQGWLEARDLFSGVIFILLPVGLLQNLLLAPARSLFVSLSWSLLKGIGLYGAFYLAVPGLFAFGALFYSLPFVGSFGRGVEELSFAGFGIGGCMGLVFGLVTGAILLWLLPGRWPERGSPAGMSALQR